MPVAASQQQPPQQQAAPAAGAQPSPDQAQALLAAVQKGLVECVQQLSQQLNVPPPVILKAVQAIVAQLSQVGPPQAAPGGVRPTQ